MRNEVEIVTGKSSTYHRIILGPIVTDEKELIGYIGLIQDITQSMRAFKESKHFSARLVEIQEEERARISREIHDSLGQLLTALQFEITAAASAFSADAGHAERLLNQSRETISKAILTAHDICHVLRPSLLDDFGLAAALKDHVKDFSTKWNLDIELTCNEIDDRLSKSAETALFRVTQECLSNVLKHAGAKRIAVKLKSHEESVELEIVDDGCGFDPDKLPKSEKKFGLLGMRERISILKGQLEILAKPGEGTTVRTVIPIRQEGEDYG